MWEKASLVVCRWSFRVCRLLVAGFPQAGFCRSAASAFADD
jgi:hypothetical protein